MNIYAKNGDKVKFQGCSEAQWQYGGHDNPSGILVKGKTYTIDHIEVHNWSTDVYLQEFPDLQFNSVCFTDVKSRGKKK